MEVVNFGYNEYKFLVMNEQLSYVSDVLESLHGGSDPFPRGIVDSIYYDTSDGRFYQQSLNGDARKRKFRIRGYGGDSFHQVHLKDKNLSVVTKLKDRIQPVRIVGHVAPHFFELAPARRDSEDFPVILSLAQHYGMLMPVVRVRYRRHRFRVNDYRITLDTHIEIMGFSNGVDISCNYGILPHHVLEIKTVDPRPYLPFLGLLGLPQVSFSKFFMGINLLSTGDISVS